MIVVLVSVPEPSPAAPLLLLSVPPPIIDVTAEVISLNMPPAELTGDREAEGDSGASLDEVGGLSVSLDTAGDGVGRT